MLVATKMWGQNWFNHYNVYWIKTHRQAKLTYKVLSVLAKSDISENELCNFDRK